MPLLESKVCVITGGAGSLGLASARLFLREGAKVMLVDLREADLERATSSLGSPNADAVAADVSDAAATRAYVERTVERFGKIDVLFSNAGNQGPVVPVTEYPEDAFDAHMAVHVRGAFLACKYGLPCMNDGGSIIITSSVVGLIGFGGLPAYVAAKHGQVGLMRAAAKELAPRRIRVNTMHPGPTSTAFQDDIEMRATGQPRDEAAKVFDALVPLGRHTTPEEIAHGMLYLAADESAMVTSHTFSIDGGLSG
jgi:NAD(P)-dependent dehydrogenase (short-subunit alcohol dehydrogenase family)